MILRGEARHLPLSDASVDLIVTSPPYFGLRAYTDGGEAYDGQIGAEPTPREYIAALLECTREWMRVLKPSGSVFVNLGDKYNSAASGQNLLDKKERDPGGRSGTKRYPGARGSAAAGIPNKSLMLLPELYRVGCVYELGLIARAVIVWSKPNGLPESVTDRVRRSHEDWVHLTRSPKYYSAVDQIREPHAPDTSRPSKASASAMRARNISAPRTSTGGYDAPSPLGKLPGSVWEIATQPLKVPEWVAHERCCGGKARSGCQDGLDHYAAFPFALVHPIILGWSPQEVCTACGEGRRPVTDVGAMPDPDPKAGKAWNIVHDGVAAGGHGKARTRATYSITGYACVCPDTTAPSTPGIVLDPFGGTGTTALVAAMHGRRGISVDLSADYCRLADWRASDPKERARAAGLDPTAVARIPAQRSDQYQLFEELA
jgi:DNA modification methylase